RAAEGQAQEDQQDGEDLHGCNLRLPWTARHLPSRISTQYTLCGPLYWVLRTVYSFLAPPDAVLVIVERQHLDLVVVVVVAGKLQGLRRRRRHTGSHHLDIARLFQPRDLLALLVLQVVGDLFGHRDVNARDIVPVGGELQHAHHVNAHALA